MPDIAGVLVVFDKHAHPDQVEQSLAAMRQLRGVAGVRTMFTSDGVAHEIAMVRQIVEETAQSVVERGRAAGTL